MHAAPRASASKFARASIKAAVHYTIWSQPERAARRLAIMQLIFDNMVVVLKSRLISLELFGSHVKRSAFR
jgi:hypothetical protein